MIRNPTKGLAFRRSEPTRALPVAKSEDDRVRDHLLTQGLDHGHIDHLLRAHALIQSTRKKLGLS